MKRLSSLALILIITSISFGCVPKESASSITREGGETYRGIDFREYTEQGFLFTQEAPEGKYESIGMLEVTLTPKVMNSVRSKYQAFKDSAYSITFNGDKKFFTVQKTGTLPAEYYAVEVLNVNDAISKMYDMASEMGADALVNLNINRSSTFNKIYIDEITVSGFAIKR